MPASDETRIEPALTSDLLGWLRRDPQDVRSALGVGMDHASFFLKGDLAKLIALANAVLPESDPRKITREMVTFIRDTGILIELEYPGDNGLLRIADAFESYLPSAE